MNFLAIVGSPRKGKATDTLVDRAIEGVKFKTPNCNIKKLHLIDHDIQFCKNCLACRDSKTKKPVAKCSIQDDMDYIREDVLKSDFLIFGTTQNPVIYTWYLEFAQTADHSKMLQVSGRQLTSTLCRNEKKEEMSECQCEMG